MPFTKDQQSAIDARGVNLLVAAAAGSGKTTVLVERVMRLVEEGANIDEMLIVTFTRAASSDMRDKLSRRFALLAAGGDARAREQMERLESASISTLHAFCMNVLRENFEAAGVDPQFRVLDDAEDRQLIDAALTDVLEEAYAAGGPDMDALDFARGPERVRELALAMYGFLRERPDAEEWVADALKKMHGNGDAWVQVLTQAARRKLAEAQAINAFAVSRALLPGGPLPYAETMEEDGKVIAAMQTLSYDEMQLAVHGFCQLTPPRRRRTEEPTPEEVALKDEVMSLRKQVKTRVEAAEKMISLDRAHSLSDIQDNAGVVRRLVEIARALERELTAQKSARAALTFSDLEHYTLKCLRDERIADRVRGKYRYVFVDEYQDTSDVQEAIVSRIARADNRFMVGDVKQSIYRFRQAEPKLFLEKYADYRAGDNGKLIVLKQNFRSRGSVIDFVNHIFRRVMNGGDSQIVYDDDAMLYRGAEFEGEDAPVELHLIDKAAPEGEELPDDEEEAELSDAEREGALIARRIHELKREDPSLRYRDICVLTRVRVGSLTYLASALSAEGIPAYADASESYFDALEVMEVVSALRLIVNRRRDIDLIAVLRSPMVGMTSRELAELRAEGRGETFLDAFTEAAPRCPKAQAFLEKLDAWRVLARAMSIPALIRRVLADTGFYTYVGALPGGMQRQANLDVLCARAAAYETAVGGSLNEFLDYAAGMRARGDGDGAHVLSENDDVVRLMTAHKSKGLEFPVVFCALLGRRFRAARTEDNLFAHRDLGLALMRMDERLGTRRDTLARRAIVQQTLSEDRAEEIRIFYVMLTRAKHRLILTGTCKDLRQSLISWQISARDPDLYNSFLDIAASAMLSCPGAEALGGHIDPKAPRVAVFTCGSHSLRLPTETEVSQAKSLALLAEARKSAPDEALKSAMLWRYPAAENVNAPVKLTASGLSREVIGVEAIPEITPRPAFLTESGLTATERGTAIHAALRGLDYAPLRGLSRAGLSAEAARQLAQMSEDGRLSPAESQAVYPSLLASFLASPVGQRLLASPRVEREWRFNLRMPAAEAIPGAPEGSEVIVQGSIDLCFLEDDQWVLVDYKTDRSDDRDALAERYAPQLRLYARALADITRLPVKEALICLVRQNEALPVAL